MCGFFPALVAYVHYSHGHWESEAAHDRRSLEETGCIAWCFCFLLPRVVCFAGSRGNLEEFITADRRLISVALGVTSIFIINSIWRNKSGAGPEQKASQPPATSHQPPAGQCLHHTSSLVAVNVDCPLRRPPGAVTSCLSLARTAASLG
jgi:hypothetical protein